MPRRPRRDYPGSHHHIINRGVGKRTVSEVEGDASRLLELIGEQVEAGRLEVLAFCILGTHFHLFVVSLIAELSEAMRRLQSVYAQGFNRSRDRAGALFQGRFFSALVESYAYQIQLVRYIDENPVLAGLVGSPEEYPYGSAMAYVRGGGPKWLSRTWVEQQVVLRRALAAYDPREYRSVFGKRLSSGLRTCVEQRCLRGLDAPEEMDALLIAPVAGVRSWLAQRVQAADGTRLGLLVTDPGSVIETVRELSAIGGAWSAPLRGGRSRDLWQVARCALLRMLAAVPDTAISVREGISRTGVALLWTDHKYRFEHDDIYATRFAELAGAAIRRCHADR